MMGAIELPDVVPQHLEGLKVGIRHASERFDFSGRTLHQWMVLALLGKGMSEMNDNDVEDWKGEWSVIALLINQVCNCNPQPKPFNQQNAFA
jgi:hypothetical protein